MTVVGLDLDNTIINYDQLFHRLALELGLWPEAAPAAGKARLSDLVRQKHGDLAWQRLQALAYGPHLPEASLFPGVPEALGAFERAGLEATIISHKTRRSSCGGYELREAALEFLRNKGIILKVYFAGDLEGKLDLIADLNCRVFVDDLPQALLDPRFPGSCHRLLFDPGGQGNPDLETRSDWIGIKNAVEAKFARREIPLDRA